MNQNKTRIPPKVTAEECEKFKKLYGGKDIIVERHYQGDMLITNVYPVLTESEKRAVDIEITENLLNLMKKYQKVRTNEVKNGSI